MIELRHRGIPARSQVVIPLDYKGESIGSAQIDILVADELVLKAGLYRLGLLINFNVPILKQAIRRIVRMV